MNQLESGPGRCPFCHASIHPSDVLIAYEASAGSAVYAECGDCRNVVRPE